MKKLLVLCLFLMGSLFASMDLNHATKQELMSIKGIGEVKANQIIDFRKSNKIKDANDLSKIKGFGPKLIQNIKNYEKMNKK